MNEPAHYPRGPSSANQWLICTDSPEAQEGYPDETSDAADEGTAAHWLLEQCLNADQNPAEWLDSGHASSYGHVVPAGEETGCIKDWPITGEMIEGVQLHIDTVRPDADKKGTRLFVEERVRVDTYMNLPEKVGGTADTILYLPRSKTLKIIDFKYGKGHAVEVISSPGKVYYQDEAGSWKDDKGPDWGVNPQLGIYALAALAELERLLGEKREVKTIELIIVQPRINHKKGKVRKLKTTPMKLMKLEGALVKAIRGPRVRIPGDHCFFCRAKSDCVPYNEVRGRLATEGFDGEAPPGTEPPATGGKTPNPTATKDVAAPTALAVQDFGDIIAAPVKGLSLEVLGHVRASLPHLKKWIGTVEEEIKTRLLHDLQVPGARLAEGRGSRQYAGTPEQLAIAVKRTAEELELQQEALYTPAELKSPSALEKELGPTAFAKTTLATMVSRTAGKPTVVDIDSDAPEYVKGAFEAATPAPEKPKAPAPAKHRLL